MWGETMRLRSGENQKTVSQTVLRAPTHNPLFVFLTVWVDLIEHQVESSKGHEDKGYSGPTMQSLKASPERIILITMHARTKSNTHERCSKHKI